MCVDGKVNAVTFATGTGGTLAGMYSLLCKIHIINGRSWNVSEGEESSNQSCSS